MAREGLRNELHNASKALAKVMKQLTYKTLRTNGGFNYASVHQSRLKVQTVAKWYGNDCFKDEREIVEQTLLKQKLVSQIYQVDRKNWRRN
jgi:hypothetical protein